jgi:hypothetical protein
MDTSHLDPTHLHAEIDKHQEEVAERQAAANVEHAHRHPTPPELPLPTLTLGGLLDALALDAMPPWGIAELQRSSDASQDLWRRMSQSYTALCAAVDTEDPTLTGVHHFVRERFGAFDKPSLHHTLMWLVAEHGLTQRQAKELPLADLLDRLRRSQPELEASMCSTFNDTASVQTPPSGAKATVNERLAAMLQEDPQRAEWSAAQWVSELAKSLGRTVAVATVKKSKTWKTQIRFARELAKIERADRER